MRSCIFDGVEERAHLVDCVEVYGACSNGDCLAICFECSRIKSSTILRQYSYGMLVPEVLGEFKRTSVLRMLKVNVGTRL